ncbi:hypothetical protein GCM10007907_05960 [Chitinimonas prasina]|uniref:Uncharacterized protein n=1 Tax=Chitinimonas prasina TaxID=1434937 RepID=A0ABQ5YE22_9NEIS|nr:hypothetical protein [Chitinimonas prasina]GLR11806.1 hypothetical protein GCM10007907_05960 [Chitinimonas prasina]
MQFTSLERQTLDWFALKCGSEPLKAQCNLAQPLERSIDGSTLILTLSVPPGVQPVNYTNAPGAPLIKSTTLFYGVGVDLWLRNGFIQKLEFSAIGGADFPEGEFPFQLVSSLNTPYVSSWNTPQLPGFDQVCGGRIQSAMLVFLILLLVANLLAVFYACIVSSAIFIPADEVVVYSTSLYVGFAVAFIGYLAICRRLNGGSNTEPQESLLHRVVDPVLGGIVIVIVLGGLGFGTAYLPGELIRLTENPNSNLDIFILSKKENLPPRKKGQCQYVVEFNIGSELIHESRCVTERFYATAMTGKSMKILAHKSLFGIVLDNQLSPQ